MRSRQEPITIEAIRKTHEARTEEIRKRLAEFDEIWRSASDLRLWEEMVYCFFTGGCSAKMGLRSVDAVRPLLISGSREALTEALLGVHRYPNARAGYITDSRKYLQEHCGLGLRSKLRGFDGGLERRDWLVNDKGIKGLGYKEASHYLRNIGFKGYAILDKHVLGCMFELDLIDDSGPPNSRSRYLNVENKLKQFADRLEIDFDEMDLVLWSMKTGEILK